MVTDTLPGFCTQDLGLVFKPQDWALNKEPRCWNTMFLRQCLGKPSILTLDFYAMPSPPPRVVSDNFALFHHHVTPRDWAGAFNPIWKTRKEPEVKGGEAIALVSLGWLEKIVGASGPAAGVSRRSVSSRWLFGAALAPRSRPPLGLLRLRARAPAHACRERRFYLWKKRSDIYDLAVV